MYEFLNALDIEYTINTLLSTISTFKTGGEADVLAFPDTQDKLISIIREAKYRKIPYAVVGNTSNSIFDDKGYRGIIVSTKKLNTILFEEKCDGKYEVICECGAMMPSVSKKAAQRSLGGFEFACGIPGTVGGGVFMNAGAHGSAISDVLISSKAYDTSEDRIVDFCADEHNFGYRESIYMSNPSLVCLEAKLELHFENSDDINAKIRENTDKRRRTQPLSLPSAGSFFKRPDGYFAARLIDECGLKGVKVGGAAVSDLHAGFIVNIGDATTNDIFKLAEYVRDVVFARTGVIMEREVRYIRSDKSN